MKKLISIFIIAAFVGGCGGGAGTSKNDSTTNPSTQNEPAPSKHFDTPILNKVQTFNIGNIIGELKSLSKSNFVAMYKKVHTLQLSGFPDLNTTFDINATSSKSSKVVNKSQKILYHDYSTLIEENTCLNGGTVHKEVHITPRNFGADTYKDGDKTEYRYDRCDMGDVSYTGKIIYHVNDFTGFDYTFGAVPLGTFDSSFNAMSTETDTQKTTVNGTIRYTAKAEYDLQPNGKQGALKNLEIKYDTVGDFVVTVYDKSTGETTTLTYNGTLEKTVYRKGSGASDATTAVDGNPSGFTYRKKTDYLLTIENGENIVTTSIKDNIPAVVTANGQIEKRPVEYDPSNTSSMGTQSHSIKYMILADGTRRYILDMDADFFPDADIKEGEPTHTLPPSDVNLMGDIVVIGFDDCPYTTSLREKLDALGLTYAYVNIHATQKEGAIFDWFNISGVPYIGIKGNYFGGAYYNDKKTLAVLLNLFGFDMNATVVKDNVPISVSMKLEDWRETLKSKEKHTALAAAIDTPHLYQLSHPVSSKNSKEAAKQSALEDCEKLRSERVGQGKKPIHSVCEIYSVDGVKQ